MTVRDRLIDGTTTSPLAIRDYGGSGPSILLVPGGSRTVTDWDPIAADLVADHRVVATDVRNHGHSGDGPWVWEEVLDDLQLVIEAAGLIAPAIVGHSLGGMIAALYSASGRRCRCAVNIDGYGSGRVDQYVGYPPAEVRRFWAEQLPALEHLLPRGPIDENGAGVYRARSADAAALEGVPPEITTAWLDRSIRNLPDGRFLVRPGVDSDLELADALSATDWFATFRAAKSPIMIYNCVGMEPEWPDGFPEAAQFNTAYRNGLRRDLAALADETSHVTVRTVDAGHMVNLTMPDMIAADVRGYVASVAA